MIIKECKTIGEALWEIRQHSEQMEGTELHSYTHRKNRHITKIKSTKRSVFLRLYRITETTDNTVVLECFKRTLADGETESPELVNYVALTAGKLTELVISQSKSRLSSMYLNGTMNAIQDFAWELFTHLAQDREMYHAI